MPSNASQFLGSAIPRRVCQFPFKRNDIVWVCRTCQADETCVLCHQCYKLSDHVGHDVAFYHAQAGGCCDCGDPDAWDPRGFCPHHGGGRGATHTNSKTLPEQEVKDMVNTIVDWMVNKICPQTQRQHLRTKQSVDSALAPIASTVPTAAAIALAPTHELTFDSHAASASKSRGDGAMPGPSREPALDLGCLARGRSRTLPCVAC